MDSVVFGDSEGLLPLASLRLLVSPLQFLSASMWQILKSKEVMSFWKVSEFVSMVMETVPELLLFKHWKQLTLGLRARFVLELCRRGEEHHLILPYLELLKLPPGTEHKQLFAEEKAADDFAEMIHELLKDDQEKEVFFQEVWCEEAQFECDLQMLFWEFLCRLNQLLPVPELEHVALWLGRSCVLEDFLQCISEPTNMKNLLHHHKQLGHLEEHVPPSGMGDHISSSLSAASQSRLKSNLKIESDPQFGLNADLQTTLFVEEAEMEIVALTGCAEIELTSTPEIQVVLLDNGTSPDPMREEHMIALPLRDVPDSSTMAEDKASADFTDESQVHMEVVENEAIANNASTISKDESQGTDFKQSPGPHHCHHCNKTFKFASFLAAHRVIHTGERPHKCSECGQCFSFRQSLERHRHMHKMGKTFECPLCHQCFPSSAARSEHKGTHIIEGEYTCHHCSKKFTQELALARHMKTHSNSTSKEEIVEVIGEDVLSTEGNIQEKVEEESKKLSEMKVTANQAIGVQLMNQVISLVQVRTSQRNRKATKKMRALQKTQERKEKAEKAKPEQPMRSFDHSYGTTNNDSSKDGHKDVIRTDASYSCPHCDFCHVEEERVRQHITESHSGQQNTEQTSTETTTERTFKCTVCEKPFQSIQESKDHFITVHTRNGEYFCTRCGKSYKWKGAFMRHSRMYCSEGGADSFGCSRCELSFDCASALYSHLQTHQEERVHVCNCGKSFAHRMSLTAHQRTHQKERPHACLLCGKGFLYKSGLCGHMKTHSEEKSFQCSHCGKSFKRERSMRKHERFHTREGVYKCSQCDKSFVYKATLTRHELTHKGERPFLCSDCGKGFFSHAELLKHERFHSGNKPFECPHCGKKFTQSCYLTIHMRYHTGAKPYVCSECDKSFLSANRLKRHQRTHTGEKPYVCGECGKGFRQSYHLKMHQRTHMIDLT